MRLAICGGSERETCCLCEKMQAYCMQEGCCAEICPIYGLEHLWREFRPGSYHGVVVGVGDTAGFLAARRIREQDGGCRLVVIDDTPRYAIQCLRLHVADFLVRPVEDAQLARSFRRLLGIS